MINRLFLSAIICASVTLPHAVAAADYKRIKKKEQFDAAVVDKTIVWEGGTAVIRSNGKTDGTTKDFGKYRGSWVWNNKAYCRNLLINKKETGTSCLKVEIADGGKLRLTYLDGKRKGRSLDAVLK